MGGGGSSLYKNTASVESLGITDDDIQQFVDTGYSGSQALVGSHVATSSVNGTTQLQDANGNDLTSVLSAFWNWRNQRDTTNTQYSQFVQTSKQSPGRDATILVPENNEPSTLLGVAGNSKSLIGA